MIRNCRPDTRPGSRQDCTRCWTPDARPAIGRGCSRAYSEKIAVMYEEIFTKDLDERWETTVGSITNENVAMIDQLPDELDDKTKAHILKEYYGELLNGLDKINKIKEL